jgi:hypothetical protein
MGQAKQRKSEIQQLKANSAKQTKQLINFGTFYRDDKDDGVSINFNTLYNEPKPGFTKVVYDNVTQCGDAMIKAVKEGDDSAESILQQLKMMIKQFNIIVFGSEVRPKMSSYQIDFSNRELIKVMMVIMSDIYVLTELGVIPNDNYNGLNIMTMIDNSKTKSAVL